MSLTKAEEARSASADPRGIVVLDFETSGVSPDQGDRAIEIGAVRIVDGRIVERFQSLMHPQRRVSRFIEDYTGITNAMLQTAPPAAQVMAAFDDFIGDAPLVAHNASFDRRFLDAELQRIGRSRRQDFACSLLAARRIYPGAPDHKLATLVAYRDLPCDGTFHRALADAAMTAHLWLCMTRDLQQAYGFKAVPFSLMQALTRCKKQAADAFLQKQAARTL